MNRQDLLNIVAPLPASSTGHVLFSGDGKVATVTSTTDMVCLSLSIEDGSAAFEACPHQDRLKAALTGLTGDALSMSFAAGAMGITAKGKRTLPCIDPKSFPKMSAPEGDTAKINGGELRDAIAFVRGAAYGGIDRPYLCGVHFNGKDVVASDGSVMRLANVKASLPTLTIPSATAALLAKVLPDDVVSIVADERRVHFSWADGELTSGLAPVGFPAAYSRIINDWRGDELVIAASELQRGVSAVSAFSDGKTKPVYLHCDKNVILSCADAEEPLDVGGWSGVPIKMLFSGVLFSEVAASYGKETVTLKIKGGQTDPLLFCDSHERKAVLMPWRQ